MTTRFKNRGKSGNFRFAIDVFLMFRNKSQKILDNNLKTRNCGKMEQVLSISGIRARRDELNESILKIQRELEDLTAAERLVLKFGSTESSDRISVHRLEAHGSATSPPAATHPTLQVVTPLTNQKPMNLSGLVHAVLKQSASLWLTTEEVRIRASDIKGENVPLGSIAPTLSILKKAGDVVRDGPKVALAERLNENGVLNGKPVSTPEVGTAYQADLPINS
jgi:hypothetical protein